MGMFDHVSVQVPLPDGWTPPGLLQTKDFDCVMQTITLTPQGRLVADGRSWYSNEVTQAEFDLIEKRIARTRETMPDYMPGKTYQIVPEERIAELARDLDFHGIVEFYGDEPRPEGSTGGYMMGGRYKAADGTDLGPWRFHEYRAKFTDGTLVEITALPDGPTVRFAPPQD